MKYYKKVVIGLSLLALTSSFYSCGSSFDGLSINDEKTKTVSFDEDYDLVVIDVYPRRSKDATKFIATKCNNGSVEEPLNWYYDIFTGEMLFTDEPGWNKDGNSIANDTPLYFYLNDDEKNKELNKETLINMLKRISAESPVRRLE